MINLINLSRAKENELKHNQNLAKQREVLSKPVIINYPKAYYDNLEKEKEKLNKELISINPKENERLIKIDKFIFSVFHNIDSIDYELSLGISKVESLTKNYYLKLGGNEERISFEARIFVEYMEHFNGFIDKIKQREPLSFSSLESSVRKKIIIDKFSAKTKDWLMDSRRNITYHTKEFSIGGVVV